MTRSVALDRWKWRESFVNDIFTNRLFHGQVKLAVRSHYFPVLISCMLLHFTKSHVLTFRERFHIEIAGISPVLWIFDSYPSLEEQETRSRGPLTQSIPIDKWKSCIFIFSLCMRCANGNYLIIICNCIRYGHFRKQISWQWIDTILI
jgi:hypothetical protein